MVGSIDPRCETLRGTHWPKQGRRAVWNSRRGNHLGQRSTNRINRPDIWMQAIRSDHQKLLRHGGRPHMGPRFRGDDSGKVACNVLFLLKCENQYAQDFEEAPL
jgi:hypothetical protein